MSEPNKFRSRDRIIKIVRCDLTATNLGSCLLSTKNIGTGLNYIGLLGISDGAAFTAPSHRPCDSPALWAVVMYMGNMSSP